MQIVTADQENSANPIFPFDFGMFCGILNVGWTQAAYSSHKRMAKSTFSLKTRSEATRANGFTQSTLNACLVRLLQMSNLTRNYGAVNDGCGRATQAKMAAPALFLAIGWVAPLGWHVLFAICGFSLTVRAEEARARWANAVVRPEIQKVRIC
jgi:hypothetical protein